MHGGARPRAQGHRGGQRQGSLSRILTDAGRVCHAHTGRSARGHPAPPPAAASRPDGARLRRAGDAGSGGLDASGLHCRRWRQLRPARVASPRAAAGAVQGHREDARLPMPDSRTRACGASRSTACGPGLFCFASEFQELGGCELASKPMIFIFRIFKSGYFLGALDSDSCIESISDDPTSGSQAASLSRSRGARAARVTGTVVTRDRASAGLQGCGLRGAASQGRQRQVWR